MEKSPRMGKKKNLNDGSVSISVEVDNELFETLYGKFALPLTKFIVKRVGGNQEAVDEIFSRTVSAAWEGFNTFKHKSKLFTWVCRIALNKIADYYRDQIHKESVFIAPTLENIGEITTTNLSPQEKLAIDELTASVRSCISLLPKEKRELIYLRYWEKWSIKKIAKYLRVSERSVEGKLYRTKQTLKCILESQSPNLAREHQKNE